MDYVEKYVRNIDPEIADIIALEEKRQLQKIELIASENFVSPAVMAAMGSALTNKYAEGYPGKRYYGGCEYVDLAENLARDRAKELFGADHVNVQPHSGAQANTAVYFSVLQPGDKIMGMDLSHGGHLTHGSPVNISGSYFEIVSYGVEKESEQINYDTIREIAVKEKPKMIVAGGSAYPRALDFKKFREIADEAGAYLMVDMAHIAGLIATGLHQNPVPYADFVTTTTHKTLRGPRGGMILCKEEYAAGVDKAIFPGTQGGPLMHVIAAKAVAFKEALAPEFAIYQKRVIANATVLASALQEKGFRIVSGGTDNHLMLVDLTTQDISGKDAECALDEASITVNKNTIPFETKSPFVTSGIRLGTPASTTRGMNEAEMKEIADIISMILIEKKEAEAIKKVAALTENFPIFAY